MTVDRRFENHFREIQATRDTIEQLTTALLRSDGEGPTDGRMEERVTRLETHMEYVRRDLDEIRADQKIALGKLDGLATSLTHARAHTAGKVTVITTGIAVVAVLLGVLAYGGDRFSQGMEVDAASKSAVQAATAP